MAIWGVAKINWGILWQCFWGVAKMLGCWVGKNLLVRYGGKKTEGWSGEIFWGWGGKKYFEKTSNQSEILHSLIFSGLVSKQKSQMEEDK